MDLHSSLDVCNERASMHSTAGATGERIELPEKEFPDFAHKTVNWQDFNEDCKNLELNKYVHPIQIISHYGNNTIKALEAFEQEVLDKKYSADEADIIL